MSNYPSGLKYTSDHEWIRFDEAEGIATVGITYFAQSELGDIVYVEVETVDEDLEENGVFGTVEAVKTTSELFLPVAGVVTEFNETLESEPELINKSPYEEGWIIKVKVANPADIEGLMSAEAYMETIGA